MSQQYQLIIQKGPQPGKILLLMTDNITIGRDPMADISLNDPEVSRQHVRLTQTASGYVLEDLGSTNGTFINGEKLEADTPVALVPGQTVSMGSGVTVLYEMVSLEPEKSEAETTFEPVDEVFDAFSPFVPESEVEEFIDPAFEESPGFPEFAPVPKEPSSTPADPLPIPPPPAQSPQTPLVPTGNSDQQKKRRRIIIIAVVSLILLCCCCLLFVLSAYFYWGDPLMKSLGLY